MDTKQLKVLLIEGQPGVAKDIENELVALDFMVSSTINVESGLLRAKAYQFDLFVVNCGANSKEGLNFATSILKEEKYKNVPFLFTLNARLKADIRLRKFDHPFDIIRLPLDATELRIRLNKLFGAKNENYEKIETAKPVKAKKVEVSKATDQKGRVLLVEDNPLNQKVLGMFISKIGFEYDIAANGEKSIELCKDTNYAFILMDIYMPGMDGTEATVKIREAEQLGNHRAKIIAITANESEESVKRCYDSGMDDFMVKPFTIDLLKEKLV